MFSSVGSPFFCGPLMFYVRMCCPCFVCITQAVSGKLPRLVQVLDNVKKTVEESGRDLIDDALQTLSSTIRQLDAEGGYGTDRSPSPSESVTPTDPHTLWGDLMGRKPSHHQLGPFPSAPTLVSPPSVPSVAPSVKPAAHTFSPRYLQANSDKPRITRASVPNWSDSTSLSGADGAMSRTPQGRKGLHSHSASMDLGKG